MKKTIITAITIVAISCNSTPTAKWNSATASKTCYDAATKGKYDLDDAQIRMLKKICNCVGEKMVATFKTEKAANDKMLDATVIANECSNEYGKSK